MNKDKSLNNFIKEIEELLGDRLSKGKVVHLNDPEIQQLFKEHGLEPFESDYVVYKAQ